MKYRIYCSSCLENKEVEGLIITTQCPDNLAHTCDKSTVVILCPNQGCSMNYLDNKDYKQLRSELIDYVVLHSGILPTDELQEASMHFCLPKEVRDMFYTIDEQIEFGLEFHKNSTNARQLRANKVMVELYNHIDLADAFEVGQSVLSATNQYVTYGLEGTLVGDPEGISDYFLCTSGTSYESTGFLTLTGINIITDITLSGLATKCVNIITYGNKEGN